MPDNIPNNSPQQTPLVVQKPRGPLRRLGCSAAVVLWFIILLTPCLCIVLATQGEIAIRLGDLPGQSLRVWLLNESRQRGLGLSRPSLHAGEHERQTCIQTDVSFALWVGIAEAATYCECYTRPEDTNQWELMSSQQAPCQR